MIAMRDFSVFIPDNLVPVMDLERETGLSKSILSVYEKIYGLKAIPVWDSNLESILEVPIQKLLRGFCDTQKIRYIIYIHTAHWVSFYDNPILNAIEKKFALSSALIWESTLYKCVGFFKALELINILLKSCDDFALILTGEIAFTPKLRVVPRSTLVGDAATASIFSRLERNHFLLGVKTKLILGYEKGIYLAEDDLICFEEIFLSEICQVIHDLLLETRISLSAIALILPHNVNIPTWRKIAWALSFPIEKIYLQNISQVGHCFCSDHLINLRSALNEDRLKPGDYYLMVGCGLGFFVSVAIWQY